MERVQNVQRGRVSGRRATGPLAVGCFEWLAALFHDVRAISYYAGHDSERHRIVNEAYRFVTQEVTLTRSADQILTPVTAQLVSAGTALARSAASAPEQSRRCRIRPEQENPSKTISPMTGSLTKSNGPGASHTATTPQAGTHSATARNTVATGGSEHAQPMPSGLRMLPLAILPEPRVVL